MGTNVFLLSMPDAVGIYLALGLCGLSIVFLALHVQRKFVRASGVLTRLNREWQDAQAQFLNLAEVAQRQMANQPVHDKAPPREPGGEISAGLRKQITTMSRNGAAAEDIARTAGLSEAEINVLLGMSRVEGGKK